MTLKDMNHIPAGVPLPFGTIIFTRANTWSSRITRFFTKEEWSHVGVAFGPEGNQRVYHSTLGTGCQVESYDSFIKGCTFESFTFEVAPVEGDSLSVEENRALECLIKGIGYDISLLPEIATNTRDKEDRENAEEAKKEMVCSEYSEYVLFGTAHSLTPGELLAIVKASLS